MTALRMLIARVLATVRGRRLDAAFDEEVRSHLERLEDEHRARGLSPQAAREAARRDFGGVESMKEVYRDQRGLRWFDEARQDVRYAAGVVLKNRGFAAVVLLTLALGIGANTAVFSVIEAVMLRELPVRDPQNLIQVTLTRPDSPLPLSFSYPLVRGLAEQRELFAGLFGVSNVDPITVGAPGTIERANVVWVSGEYYATLGLSATIGRLLARSDDERGAQPVAVLSDGYWRRRFGSDPGVVGRPILVEGTPVVIAGVSPPGFAGPIIGEAADLTLMVAQRQRIVAGALIGPNANFLRVLARAPSGLSIDQLEARLAIVWPRVVDGAIPPTVGGARNRALGAVLNVVPGGTGITELRRLFSRPLFVLMALVGLVLLIACANVTNLLLARTAARQPELTVRMALGAGRGRLVRQLLTETLVLSAAGGLLGVALAWFGSRSLVALIAGGPGRAVDLDVTPNPTVLAFTLAVALAAALVCGLAPAIRGARASRALYPTTARATTSHLFGGVLVTVQIAVSLLLLIGAGLFVRTLQNLRNVDPGFRHEGVLVAGVDGRRSGYRDERLAMFYEELRQAAARLPGITSATFTMITPLSGASVGFEIDVNGQPGGSETLLFNPIGPGYFETLSTAIVAGRDFTPAEQIGMEPAVIVNQAFVRAYLSAAHPLGQRVSIRGADRPQMVVVGVVDDTLHESLRESPPPTLFIPFPRTRAGGAIFAVAVHGSLADAAARLRDEFQARLPESVVEVRGLSDQVERTLIRERLVAVLATVFGALALILAAVGLYGVLAYSVTRRIPEIGVRVALGATPRDLIHTVTAAVTRSMAAGILLGLAGAWAASRAVTSMLFGLSGTDASTFGIATAVLILSGIAAAAIPMRRAVKVDAIVALRCE